MFCDRRPLLPRTPRTPRRAGSVSARRNHQCTPHPGAPGRKVFSTQPAAIMSPAGASANSHGRQPVDEVHPNMKIKGTNKGDGKEHHEVKTQVVLCKDVYVAGVEVASSGRTVLDVVF